MVDPLRLTVDACLAAVADAGLTWTRSTGCPPTRAGWGRPASPRAASPRSIEALQLRPTWINGAGDTPGQSGAIVAAMLAVASGLCRHVLCFRTLWESSYAALVRDGRWDQPPARATGMTEYPGAVRRDVGRELDRRAGVPLLPPLRRRPRDARLGRGQRPRQRRPQPGGGLPRAVHHRRLLRRPPGDHPVRALRLRRAGRRRRRGGRLRDRDRRRPAAAAGAGRGGRHADPGTAELGPGHAVARAADQGTVPAPVEPDQPAPGRRGPRAAVRRLHLQRGLLAGVARVLRAGRRPRLHRRRPRHRPRRSAAGEPARRAAVGRPPARLRARQGGDAAAAGRGGWPPGAGRPAPRW